MFTRVAAVVAALAMLPAVTRAEEAAVDPAILQGQLESLREQFAETKGVVDALSRFKVSGYVQGRWEWAENTSYTAGANVQNQGFFLRRVRFKPVYDAGSAKFVLQLDTVPDGVSVKEAYAEWTPGFVKGLSLAVGQVLLPFGYDVGVRSSSDLDLLERNGASRAFLNGEYDKGVVLSYLRGPVSFRGGLFNGNGAVGKTLNGSSQFLSDNDNTKDAIGRLGLDLGMVTGGLSGWYGEERIYKDVSNTATPPAVVVAKGVYKRKRFGADVQVYLDLLPVGGTAVKAEYLAGTTQLDPDPAKQQIGKAGYGWSALVTQLVGSSDQVAVRYDYFDARSDLKDGSGGSSTGTWSFALHHHLTPAAKLSVVYDLPGLVKKPTSTTSSNPKGSDLIAQLQVKF